MRNKILMKNSRHKLISINLISQHISLKTSKKKSKWVWSWGRIWAKLGPMLWKKVKKQVLSISSLHILHGEYLLKQKVVIAKTLEWKFKAYIARNATFKGRLGPNFCLIWVKNGKKLIIFKNFTLLSQS